MSEQIYDIHYEEAASVTWLKDNLGALNYDSNSGAGKAWIVFRDI